MAKDILIVEDEAAIREMVGFAISKAGFDLRQAADVRDAELMIANRVPDLVLLDWMLPGVSGIELARRLKREETTREVPIIMLTARGEEEDKVRGFEVGADDYVTKPFSMRELMARIRAMLRRAEMMKKEALAGAATPAACLKVGEFEIDTARHRVLRSGIPVELSRMEFALLEFLARNQGQVFTRDHLLEKVWGYDFSGDTRTVDVHVAQLRKKLEGSNVKIETVTGVGYKLAALS